MYLKNSQASRDLPTPATPETSTRRAELALGGAVEELLDEAQLVVSPDEGGLEDARALRAGDGGDDPGRLEEANRLGLALQLVLAGVDVGDRPPPSRPGSSRRRSSSRAGRPTGSARRC